MSTVLATIGSEILTFDEKLSIIAAQIKERKTLIEQMKIRRNSISADISNLEDEEESIKTWLRENMDTIGIVKICGFGIVVTAKSGAEVVNITDESLLPKTFFRVKTEIDKAAIKKAIKSGELVDGAEIVPGRTSIQIELC